MMKRLNDYWIECEECGVLMISKENHECVCLRPERLNPETSKDRGCDSLNSVETQRGISEEGTPPNPFKCTQCGILFDPSDWQNDICDDCLYKRKRSQK